MIKGLKICGISEPEILNYILNHPHPPNTYSKGTLANHEDYAFISPFFLLDLSSHVGCRTRFRKEERRRQKPL